MIDGRQDSIVKKLIQALWSRLHGIVGVLLPKQQDVGVENRFYFDEVEKVWKLRGGETEAERAESEAMRFHTSRGLSNSVAPPTTACDASRGVADEGLPPPPPPTGGPVCRSLYGPSAGPASSAFSHPVYAPQGLGTSTPAQAPPPAQPPIGVGVAGGAPLASPFGAVPAQSKALATPLASPFGAAPAAASTPSPGPTLTPTTSPFAQAGGYPREAPAAPLASHGEVEPAAAAESSPPPAPAPAAGAESSPEPAPAPIKSPFAPPGQAFQTTPLATPFKSTGGLASS